MPFSLTGPLPETDSARMAASTETSETEGDQAPIVIDELPVEMRPFYLVDSFREDLLDEMGNLIGYRDTVSGMGYATVTDYDLAMNFLRSEYRDDAGYRSTTTRESVLDAAGNVVGYRETSSGEGYGFSYTSSTEYDNQFRLVSASYSDGSGYTSSTLRSELRDDSGTLIGYRVESSGAGNGYGYTSTETYDQDYTYVASDYADSSGYHSTYALSVERDEAGNIVGYVSTYSWTDGSTTYSNTDRYDANWNYLGGDSVKPDVSLDDGPTVVPVVYEDTARIAADAASAAEQVGTQSIDGSKLRGAALNGSDADDVFYVDDVRDSVASAGTGSDTVASSTLSLDLRRDAYDGVRDATLLGREDLRLIGDEANNTLSGNAGDNAIAGGKGSDTLFGGFGEDSFRVGAQQAGKADRISDFTHGEDTIALPSAVFAGLFDSNGTLREGVIGDQLRFQATTQKLRFDPDGLAGPEAGKVIAVLIGVDQIHASDFTANWQ